MLLYQRRPFYKAKGNIDLTLDLNDDPFVDHGTCSVCEPKPFDYKHLTDPEELRCMHLQKHTFMYYVFTTLSKLQTLQTIMINEDGQYKLPTNKKGVHLYYGGLFQGLSDRLNRIERYYDICLRECPSSIPPAFRQPFKKTFFVREIGTNLVQYESEDNLVCSTSIHKYEEELKPKMKRTRDGEMCVQIKLTMKDHITLFGEWLRTQIDYYYKHLRRPCLPRFDKLIGAVQLHRKHEKCCALDCLLDSWIVTSGAEGGAYYFSEKSFVDLFNGRNEVKRKPYSNRIDTWNKKMKLADYITQIDKKFDYDNYVGFTLPEDSNYFSTFLSTCLGPSWCTSC